MLAKNLRAPRPSRMPASSLTTIASMLAPTEGASVRRKVQAKKTPRPNEVAGQGIWLVAANQRSSVKTVYRLATDSGCQPPPRAL
jgi:6-phosphogluconolactonase (cycloisomerase 2 family)